MNQVSANRDFKLEILRFISIICIILAHTNPPKIIFLFRNFDVTLMVIVMGAAFYLSNKNNISYGKYIIKRFKRLIIPTWIFLSIFFILFYIISLLLKQEYKFGFNYILESYLLIGGMDYLWIIRVLFLVAILNPVILKISSKIKNNRDYFLFLSFIYILYRVFINITTNLVGVSKIIFQDYIILSIGWGIISAIGIRLMNLTKKERYMYATIFFIIFICLIFRYDFTSTQKYKYPPTMYYMSYGIFMGLIFLIVLDIKNIYNIFDNNIVKYISKKSLCIYFGHIIAVYIINIYGDLLCIVNDNFITRFIFILLFALLSTISQDFILKKIRRTYFNKKLQV